VSLQWKQGLDPNWRLVARPAGSRPKDRAKPADAEVLLVQETAPRVTNCWRMGWRDY